MRNTRHGQHDALDVSLIPSNLSTFRVLLDLIENIESGIVLVHCLHTQTLSDEIPRNSIHGHIGLNQPSRFFPKPTHFDVQNIQVTKVDCAARDCSSPTFSIADPIRWLRWNINASALG